MTELNAAVAATPSESSQGQDSESVPSDVSEAFNRMMGNAGEAEATTSPAAGEQQTESEQQQDAAVTARTPQQGTQRSAPQQQQGQEPDPVATLDPALKHAARRAGWSEDDLRDFVKTASPQVVESTLTRLYQSYNDISTRFAQFGQQRPQQPQQGYQQPRQSAPQPQSPFDALATAFSDENVQAMRDEYGDQLVDKLIDPLRALVQPLQQMQQFIEVQRNETIAREVDVTMKELSKDFGELYGEHGKAPTPPQQTMRQQLFAMADQIMTGAHAQGLQMTVGEAIERANLYLAAPTMAQRERQKIAGKVKDRSRQITARPSQRTTPAIGVNSDEKAEQAIADKFRQLQMSQ